ncbi:MarR family winged helix-turn-helix transcriptional regulator [Microbacterium horticulturae]|uniref:MarR family winged helix-turn-helix transcriptional regulator n=1 Tax=Microbacterium horticulturae TaxID=3028316 RepID=A0ABY8BWL2_9MICO|nr:MarR family winged helix-turn-helix transcriptional regulator [Microbacterium sp. KACC 23027]WEG08589.1 MarR family winged helix-turn-helix transcriptional regulator [Microbacterium sp. KACC 23027]
MSASTPDPADAIVAALARLRGRRGPRPNERGVWGLAPHDHDPRDGHDPRDHGAHAGRGGAHGDPRGGGGHGGAHGGAHGDPYGDPHGDPYGDAHGGPHGDGAHGGVGGRPGPYGPHGGGHPMAAWPGGHGRFAGPARFRLLEALVAASTPLSVSEIADRIGVDQPRASRLVQQCVGLGLVRREADPDDARRTRIVLTDDGARLVKGFRGNRRAAIEDALADFTADERTELARLLTKLADAWED